MLQGKRRKAGVVPRLLSVRDAAEALSVSAATIYALCRRGEMPHLRVSNAIRIPALVVERVRAKARAAARFAREAVPTVRGCALESLLIFPLGAGRCMAG